MPPTKRNRRDVSVKEDDVHGAARAKRLQTGTRASARNHAGGPSTPQQGGVTRSPPYQALARLGSGVDDPRMSVAYIAPAPQDLPKPDRDVHAPPSLDELAWRQAWHRQALEAMRAQHAAQWWQTNQYRMPAPHYVHAQQQNFQGAQNTGNPYLAGQPMWVWVPYAGGDWEGDEDLGENRDIGIGDQPLGATEDGG